MVPPKAAGAAGEGPSDLPVPPAPASLTQCFVKAVRD